MQREVLKHRASCSGCASKLPPRAEAWVHHDPDDGEVVVCDTCYRMGVMPAGLVPYVPEGRVPGVGLQREPTEPVDEHLSEKAVESVAESLAHSLAEAVTNSVEESAREAKQAAALEAAARAAWSARVAAAPLTEVAPLEAGELIGDPTRTGDAAENQDHGDLRPPGWSPADELFQGPPDKAPRIRPPAAEARPEPEPSLVPESVRRSRPAPLDPIARALVAAENRGLVWFGPRRTTDGQRIDHLVLSANGVWLVTAAPAPEGPVERRDLGDWFTPQPRLFVAGVDHTGVATTCDSFQHSVTRTLVGTPAEGLPVYPVLCFEDLLPKWLEHPFDFGGVWVTWSRHLVEPMLSSVLFDRAEMGRLADLLDRLFIGG